MTLYHILLTLVVQVMCDKESPSYSSYSLDVTDSYSNPVGTSYTVPLTASYSAPVPADTAKYSVSGDDLDRNDLSASSSLSAPVFSNEYDPVYAQYSAPSSSYQAQQPSSAPQQETYPRSAAYQGAPVAEERDGAGHDHGHGHGGHGAHAEHGAVEAAAPVQTYEQSEPVSTGNLYYYYYPVQAQPIVEKQDTEDELDPLVLVLLPVTLIVGVLALLSIFNVSIGGRSFGRQNDMDQTFGSVGQLQAKVDQLLSEYQMVLSSDRCMDRVVCELGSKAKDMAWRSSLMTVVDWIIPEQLSGSIGTFKKSINEGYEVNQCKEEFICSGANIIDTKRK